MEKHSDAVDSMAHMDSMAHKDTLAVGGGPLTWHGILGSLVSICNPSSAASTTCSVGDLGATVKEKSVGKQGEVNDEEPIDSISSQDDEPTGQPSAESKSHSEGPHVPATGVIADCALANLASRAGTPDLTPDATLLLLGDCRADGPQLEVAVTGVLAVCLVERLPVFHELGLAPANRICMLDVRLLEGSKKRLCVRSLSQRVSVNGKPVGDRWQPLADGDALGLGHTDGADRDARTVYAVTYLLEEQERRQAMALAFAQDALAAYEIELPPGAVEEAGVPDLVAWGAGEAWEVRAKRAHDELLAVGAVARAIVDSGRRQFMEWAKDEAAAHGVSFGSRTEKALNRVGVAIAKCYEDSGFTLPPAMYWAVEGLVKCKVILQCEAAHSGEMDLAASKLQQLVMSSALLLDPETVSRIVQVLVGEFDEERQLDPDSALQSVVNRVWRDIGEDEVQSFVCGTSQWTKFHLDVRARITRFSRKAGFAKHLSEFLRSLTESRGSQQLSLDVLNHALSLALAKGNSSAIETVLSVYRDRGEVNAGTFQAWLLQARRSSGWSSIAEVMTRGVLAQERVPLLTQALIDLAQSVKASSSLPPAKSLAHAKAVEAEAALPHGADNDDQVSSDDDDDGEADQEDDELFEEADEDADRQDELLGEADGDAQRQGDELVEAAGGDEDWQSDELVEEADGDADWLGDEFVEEADGGADWQDDELVDETDEEQDEAPAGEADGDADWQVGEPLGKADEDADRHNEQLLKQIDGDVDWQDDELEEAKDGDADWGDEESFNETVQEGGEIGLDQQLEDKEEAEVEEEFESEEVSDDLSQEEEEGGRDAARVRSRRAWHWLAATSESLPSQLARPRAAKSLEQKFRSALRRKDEEDTFCMHWEHALVFDDCPPLVGFRRGRDMKHALRDVHLQNLELVRVHTGVRSDTAKSNSNHKHALPGEARVATCKKRSSKGSLIEKAKAVSLKKPSKMGSLLDKAKVTNHETRSKMDSLPTKAKVANHETRSKMDSLPDRAKTLSKMDSLPDKDKAAHREKHSNTDALPDKDKAANRDKHSSIKALLDKARAANRQRNLKFLLDRATVVTGEEHSDSQRRRGRRPSVFCPSREDSGRMRAWSRGRPPPPRRKAPLLVKAGPGCASEADDGRESRLMRCEPWTEPYAAVDQDGIVVLYKPPYWTVTTTANAKEEAAITSKAPRIQTWLTRNLGGHYPFIAQNPRAGLVHRLDVQTSGPILVATNSQTFEEMRCNLRQKTWYKEYIALMHGTVPPRRSTGVLNYKLFTQPDRGSGWRTEVNHKKGEDATTKYEALEAYRCRTLEKGGRQRFTLMRLQIITGRTHQIRVHLAEFARELGLQVRGIVGDYKYLPSEQAKADRRLCQRVFLHAKKLHFPPPKNKGPLFQVSCPLPPELRRVLGKLERDERTTEQFKDKARREPALPVDHDSEAVAGSAPPQPKWKRCRTSSSKGQHRGGSFWEHKSRRC